MTRDQPEQALERYFVRKVHDAGGIAEKFTSPGRRGVPDRIVMWPEGVVHFVELKTPTGTLTKLQQIDHEIRKRLGQKVFVIRNPVQVDLYVSAFFT